MAGRARGSPSRRREWSSSSPPRPRGSARSSSCARSSAPSPSPRTCCRRCSPRSPCSPSGTRVWPRCARSTSGTRVRTWRWSRAGSRSWAWPVSPLGIAGSVLGLFAGGLAAALIAGACVTLSDRAQTRSMALLGGLAPRMPNLGWLLVIAALALLGVPILATFAVNVMTFFGAFKTQPLGAFALAASLAVCAVALAVILGRVLFGAPNADAPGVSDVSLGETWYLGLLAGALLWVGLFPGGPKIPGTEVPLFDPGLINQMSAGISDIASPYVLPTPAAPATQ